jgi:glycosyltransferase involved in cell wall biosynthesis
MKVAQVCFLYYPSIGGVQTHVMGVSEALSRKQIEVEVLTTDPTNKLPKEELINQVRVKRFKSWAPMGDFHFSGELKSYLRKHYSDYDIVHTHSYNDFPALYASQAKNSSQSKTPFFFTPHYHGTGSKFLTSILHKLYKPILGSKIFKRADLVVCVSKYERNLVEKNFSTAKNKILIIPNGIEVESDSPTLRQKEKPSHRYVLYVGRIEPYKHVDRLVKALSYISNKDVSLVLVGNGPSKKKIENMAHHLAIQNRIEFHENLTKEQLSSMYRNASVLVNLSELEAYGLTVSEALARGTPCVVANSSGLAEWIDGINCFGVDDSKNPRLIAKMIESAMGKRASGVKLLTWDDVAQSLIEAYSQKISCYSS